MPQARPAFEIGGRQVAAGTRATIDLPISVLSNHTPVNLSVHVIHGAEPGPVLFLCAALHGDEILGVEIIRRILRRPGIGRLSGTLLAVPVVNAFGFLSQSRYMPDRRDLNRSFPGSANGSLAAQLAHLFMEEVVRRADFGIDLHTAAIHRVNLPQVRVGAPSERLLGFARAFGAPVGLVGGFVEGSMRLAAHAKGVEVLLYEAGEALRFDEVSVRIGVRGIITVMRLLAMLPAPAKPGDWSTPVFCRSSRWLRAPGGGILRVFRRIGDVVAAGEVLGCISDPFGESELQIAAAQGGIIIGRTNLPVVNRGDALFHIAFAERVRGIEERIDEIEQEVRADPLLSEEDALL